jgi:hypothetical protein
MSTLQQNWRRGQSKFCQEARRVGGRERRRGQGGEMALIMYTHMNKRIKKKI